MDKELLEKVCQLQGKLNAMDDNYCKYHSDVRDRLLRLENMASQSKFNLDELKPIVLSHEKIKQRGIGSIVTIGAFSGMMGAKLDTILSWMHNILGN